ncbi:SMI1/KNR4 family protein [Escherichia coli]|nr:SMI1/KNR4 family protein [Escherichia coli]EJE3859852.1 SMI1/KNR4 family protein [Escherichia coli]EJZ1811850.1 SMI1/KNR4 family protein [Escherichia coli]ELA5609147.1 SMI1/KNR4 family protein [Escherichia coli]
MQLSAAEQSLVERIKQKIPRISSCDPNCGFLGAKQWEYRWPPAVSEETLLAFEQQSGVSLPRAYRIFLRYIANGGPCYGYGLWPIEQCLVQGLLSVDNRLPQRLSQLDIQQIQEIAFTDEGHHPVFNGLLQIGFNDIYLVITGQYRGRLLLSAFNSDFPVTSETFQFLYDADFLSWYERWLDEIVAGMDMETFGTDVPGSQAQLRALFMATQNSDALSSLTRFPLAEPETLALWESVCRTGNDPASGNIALKALINARAECVTEIVHLHLTIPGAYRNNAVQLLRLADKKGFPLALFTRQLVRHLAEVTDFAAFAEAVQFIQQSEFNCCETFAPIFQHVSCKNVLWLTWGITQAKDFATQDWHVALFEPLFQHPDSEICKQAIYALFGVRDPRVPAWVNDAATRFPDLTSLRRDYYRRTWEVEE